LAIDSGCSYLEMRDVKSQPGDWQLRTDKVGMLRPLPESLELFSRQVGSKLRSQVKRADRERPEVAIGGVELLCDFHEVFSQNMRDVGTPALPRKFFKAVLERGGDECRIVAIRLGSIPVAAGFLITYGGRTEIPWAACRADAKPLGMNMKLYWEALSFAIRRGSRTFDFGRSTIGAGTFRFKQQWGASPVQLHWHRWERRPSGEGGAGKTASFLWKKLPMPLANVLSPLISPTLPW
jgi:serine/alanine adding enzyme